MPDKNDDIKQLFAHLGLNPNDYQEIRSAPTASVTVSEPPRRWSLLQGAPKVAEPLPQPAAAAKAPVASTLPDALGAILGSATQQAPVTQPSPVPVPTPAMNILEPSSLPPLVEPEVLPPMDGLQSLFQSVKEPQTVSTPVVASEADEVLPTLRHPHPSIADAPRTETGVLPASTFTAPAHPAFDDEPETRFAPPPARRPAAAVPAPAPIPPQIPFPVQASSLGQRATAAANAAEGRLRLSFGDQVVGESATGNESLQDVFRRLSGAARG